MSVKMINLFQSVQLPGSAGATRCINRNTMPNIRVERVDVGFELHFGKLDDKKQWQPTGLVKTVTWQNVVDFEEERRPVSAAKVVEQKR